jgi:protease I
VNAYSPRAHGDRERLSFPLFIEPSMNDSQTIIRRYQSAASIPSLDTTLMAAFDAPANAALRAMMVTPPADRQRLSGKRIAVLSTDGVEEIELIAPLHWLRDRGAIVDLVAPAAEDFPPLGLHYPAIRSSHILTIRFIETAGWVPFDRRLQDADPTEYDAVIIPGGCWNPDILRNLPPAIGFIESFAKANKLVAAICHGPQVLINAGLVRGRKIAAWWSVRADIENAGGTYVDQPVSIDRGVITGRYPLDLPPFLEAIQDHLLAR